MGGVGCGLSLKVVRPRAQTSRDCDPSWCPYMYLKIMSYKGSDLLNL